MLKPISLLIDGHHVVVAEGASVAAAIAIAGGMVTRVSVSGMPRAPLCGMGVCQECRVTVDGRGHQLACQTLCASGMAVSTAPAQPPVYPAVSLARKAVPAGLAATVKDAA